MMRKANFNIKGLTISVPKRTVEVPEGRFKKLTGIERRRICPPDIYLNDLARPAIETLLKELQWEKNSISSLIMITQTPVMTVPGTACILHGELDLPLSCATFDINLGCSGYVYGLFTAGRLLDESNKRALLVVGETTGKNKEHTYAPMFGDAVSVTALEYSPNSTALFELMTNGKRYDAITERCLYGNPDIKLAIEDGVPKADTCYVLKGEDIYQFSVKEAPAAVKRMEEASGVLLADLDGVIFHQANKMINKTLQKRLGLRDDQVPSTLKNFGNTSSATIPITLSECKRDEISTSAKVQLCGFGVGLSWGTAYMELNNVICPPLIEL